MNLVVAGCVCLLLVPIPGGQAFSLSSHADGNC